MEILKAINVPGIDNEANYEISEVHFDSKGLIIFLHENEITANICVRFSDFLSYNVSEESYLLKLWGNLSHKKAKDTFYLIENSTYLSFFNEMSLGVYETDNIGHYSIYTDNICIDVLSRSYPKIFRVSKKIPIQKNYMDNDLV